jgi:probable rRNA maturation factor
VRSKDWRESITVDIQTIRLGSSQAAPRFAEGVDTELLRRVVTEAARREGVEQRTLQGKVALSVVITDDEAVQELNRQFRGVDAPTDVLAFGSGKEGDFVTVPGEPAYLGDVVISYPRAVAQAEEYGHSISRELALLAVHGLLHLLGYDHVSEAERTEMWAKQNEILESLVL